VVSIWHEEDPSVLVLRLSAAVDSMAMTVVPGNVPVLRRGIMKYV
jgi:hypothetical protein